MDDVELVALWRWTEQEFHDKLASSAIHRIGYERWLRNLAVGLGNAPSTPEIIRALNEKLDFPSPLVQEHLAWALQQHSLSEGPTSVRGQKL